MYLPATPYSFPISRGDTGPVAAFPVVSSRFLPFPRPAFGRSCHAAAVLTSALPTASLRSFETKFATFVLINSESLIVPELVRFHLTRSP